jgi:hypothetical protein
MTGTPKPLTYTAGEAWLAQGSWEAMKRFYFHVRCHSEMLSKDELGLHFSDVVIAYNAALHATRDLDYDFVGRGRNPHDCIMEVECVSGKLVLSLSFPAIFNEQAKAVDP